MTFFQLAPALIGLLGVLVGAAATSGVTYLDKHTSAKTNERGAERIVLAEVMADNALLKRHAPGVDLADADWSVERERLAGSLSNVEWAWVVTYYGDLARAKSGIRTHDAIDRLKTEESCTLVALNVSQYFKGLGAACTAFTKGPLSPATS
jgi:hypothetical protein